MSDNQTKANQRTQRKATRFRILNMSQRVKPMPRTSRVWLVELVITWALARGLPVKNILHPATLNQLAVHVMQVMKIGEDGNRWHGMF